MAAGEKKTTLDDDKKLLDFCTRINEELIRGMVQNEKIDVTKLMQFKNGSIKLDARHAWASRLVDCLEVHFHSVNLLRKLQDSRKEAEDELKERAMNVQRQGLVAVDNHEEAIDDYWIPIIEETKEAVIWIANRASQLQMEACHIPRLRQRLVPHESGKIKVVPLFSIKNKNLMLKKGEQLLLLSNAHKDTWKVKNEQTGQVYNAPALVMLMLGPNADCVKLLHDFKHTIDVHLKKTIDVVSTYLTHSLKSEFKKLKYSLNNRMQLPMSDKRTLQDKLRSVRRVSDSYLKGTAKYDAFNTLLTTVEKNVSAAGRGYQSSQDIQDSTNILSNTVDMLVKYEDLMKDVTKLLDKDLPMGLDDSRKLINHRRQRPPSTDGKPGRRVWEITYVMKEIHRKEEVTYVADTNAGEEKVSAGDEAFQTPEGWTHFDEEAESKVATTFQVLRSEGEQTTKFIIEGVIDPRTGEMISMDEAIDDGILIQEEGIYKDITTGESCPIPEAMNDGRIVMTIKDTSSSETPSTSFGMVSIKKMHEGQRSYKIHHVVHPITGEVLNVDEATNAGIINSSGSIYINPKSGNEIIIAEAIKKKLVYAEMEDAPSSDEDEDMDLKHFVISSVVDRKMKRRVSFRQATLTGLIDRETGAYIDNVTGKRVYVADAIGRGFLKAKEVDDPTDIDIEPENTMYVERVQQIKKKLLKPLGVLSAFKRGAKKNVIQEGNEDA